MNGNGKRLTMAFYLQAGMILLIPNVLLVSDVRHSVGVNPLAAIIIATVAQVLALALLGQRINGEY